MKATDNNLVGCFRDLQVRREVNDVNNSLKGADFSSEDRGLPDSPKSQSGYPSPSCDGDSSIGPGWVFYEKMTLSLESTTKPQMKCGLDLSDHSSRQGLCTVQVSEEIF